MSRALEQLVDRFEGGQITRRELLAGLSALLVSAGATATASAAAPVATVKQLNHVTLFVPDVAKSVAFYQDLFAMPVLTRQDPGVNLNAGAGFVGIYPLPVGATSSINHLCLGLDNFDAETTLRTLTERGVKGRIRLRGDTKELYFTDPDNISVQLQDVRYKGGVGPLGDRDPK